MRTIIVAAIVAVVLGAANYFALNARQAPTGAAYTSASARIDPHWPWRSVAGDEPGAHAACEPRRASQWIFVDLHHPAGESPLCSYSQ